jgi:SulP family sulfate permease
LGVAVLGVLAGLGLAVGLALVNLVYRNAFPHDAVLGRSDGQGPFGDVSELEQAATVPGLVIYRFDAPLFFANATRFEERVRGLVEDEPARGVLIDCEAVFYIDPPRSPCSSACARTASGSAPRG